MSDAETDARRNARHDGQADARFGGLTPSEAAQRRWAQERAREGSADIGNADEVPSDAQIISALRRKAARGDASAARELREWLNREDTSLRGDAWMEALNARERRFVRYVIERALRRAGQSALLSSSDTPDGFANNF
jgi:hypothetical protein